MTRQAPERRLQPLDMSLASLRPHPGLLNKRFDSRELVALQGEPSHGGTHQHVGGLAFVRDRYWNPVAAHRPLQQRDALLQSCDSPCRVIIAIEIIGTLEHAHGDSLTHAVHRLSGHSTDQPSCRSANRGGRPAQLYRLGELRILHPPMTRVAGIGAE
jgi:hypothetical protein